MSCPEQDTIAQYLHNQLSSYEKNQLETHLRLCPACQERVKESHAQEARQGQLEHLQIEPEDMLTNAPIERVHNMEQAQQLLGDRYQFIQKIGQSATSIMFQATEKKPQRQVAVKFLGREKSLAGADSWDVARRVSQVNHPYIAQVYDIGQITHHRFIVMEWIEGRPLDQAWEDLDWQQRLCIYLKVLQAVKTAHHHHIVHRNIKPSNILVTPDLNPKLIDFGIATTIGQTAENQSPPIDTPAYLAPEQIVDPANITPATDIYALGVVLYQLLTNLLPFRKNEYHALLDAIRNEQPRFPDDQERYLPMVMQYICLKCLEKLPHNHYPDIDGLIHDIQRYLRGEMVWTRPSLVSYTVQQDLFYHRQKLNLWRDNQLLGKPDYYRLIDIYDRMISPGDPTLLEAARLTFSQVCLYLGAWTVLLGGLVLFHKPWHDVPLGIRPLPAVIVILLMISLGMVLWIKRETRLAVGSLITADLLIPVTVALSLAQGGLFSVEDASWGYESLYHVLTNAGLPITVGNLQLLMATWSWLGSSLVFWWMTRSSIFFLLSLLSLVALFTCHYMAAGLVHMPLDAIGARYLLIGFILFIAGAAIDRLGRKGHAWPAAVLGTLFIIAPLTLISFSHDTLIGWFYAQTSLFTRTELRWLSILLCGVLYEIMSVLCLCLGTGLQRRLGTLFSWIGPIHIMTALIILNQDFVDRMASHQTAYEYLLLFSSLVFIFTSTLRQKKTLLLVAGLVGLAASVFQFTRTTFEGSFAWPVLLISAGIGLMFTAWLIPQWRAYDFLRSHKVKNKQAKNSNW